MMRAFDPAFLEAFEHLLALPDLADLPRRGHALRWEGEPNRRVTRLLPLVMCWLQQHLLESDAEEPLAPATHTGRVSVAASRFRLLPRTGAPRIQRPELESPTAHGGLSAVCS
jgi:hypothetical protein